MSRSIILYILTGFLFSSFLNAQTFTRITTGDIVNNQGQTFGHSWGDYNNDGWLDLIANNLVFGQNNFFYRNNGDGTFTRIDTLVISENGPSTSTTWGDYNNDGHCDLFSANGGTAGNARNNLYLNNGNGSFTKIIEGTLVNSTNSFTAASWVDFNHDGRLDLFVGSGSSNPNAVYNNDGNNQFTRIALPDQGRTWGVSWADYDDDGDPDFYCANWAFVNYLYQNEDGEFFTRITSSPVLNGPAERSVGASWGDYDNDLDFDLFVANSGARNRLYRNTGSGNFTEITSGPVVTDFENSEGSCWADYDNDGDLDLFVAGGGNVAVGLNSIYNNDGTGNFTKVTGEDLVTRSGRYEGLTCVDYDNDGDLDVFLSNWANQNNILYRNNGNSNNWSNITCVGTRANRSGIGVKVYVKATVNGNSYWQLRQITAHTGHVAQGSLRAHFGLGGATSIDSLRVVWPSFNVDVFENVPVNEFITVTENTGITSLLDRELQIPTSIKLDQNYPNPFNPSTTITFSISKTSAVVLTIYDSTGQEIRQLRNSTFAPGEYSVVWDGKNAQGKLVGSGMYIYKLRAGSEIQSRKMMLVK